MDSDQAQKRRSAMPHTVRARLSAEPGAPSVALRSRWLVVVPWLLLAALIALATWACLTIRGSMARSVEDELQLALAANVELVHRLLNAPGAGSDPRPAMSAADFAGALARLPRLARIGRSGESYVFDRRGVMLSRSRFEAELRAANLFSACPEGPCVELRDPGGPVAPGFAPTLARREQPFTRVVREAVAGGSGVDVEGYRNYRGVEVVGAWRWLPAHDLGLAVEIDSDQAYASPHELWKALLAVCLAVLAALLAVLGSMQLYRHARTEFKQAQQLGQYTLVRELGRGGMGTVYEARHALLRRPTAVKLMNPPNGDGEAEAEALLRFEREVQLTSQLSHPNTVVIYDYGRSDDGVFYYAMEYIDGVDLDRLVRLDGPLPAGRVIHFALQICGSLAEAHDKSLIHRDIKPANVLVCERGGLPDTIKVLDFGLVKSLLGPQVSAAHVLVGTPQFMAPEVLRSPSAADPRSDIYAVGAVLYWLATGHTAFEEEHPLAALSPHAKLIAPTTWRPELPVDLERAILRCLAREPLERPASMEELARELRSCRAYGSWSVQDARRYWRERGDALVRQLPAATGVPTLGAS